MIRCCLHRPLWVSKFPGNLHKPNFTSACWLCGWILCGYYGILRLCLYFLLHVTCLSLPHLVLDVISCRLERFEEKLFFVLAGKVISTLNKVRQVNPRATLPRCERWRVWITVEESALLWIWSIVQLLKEASLSQESFLVLFSVFIMSVLPRGCSGEEACRLHQGNCWGSFICHVEAGSS